VDGKSAISHFLGGYIYVYQWRNKIKIQIPLINEMNTKLVTVSGVCCLSLLRVYACVSCSIFILFVYMYVRMPSSPGSIAGVPSSQALPGYRITIFPSVCILDVMGALAVWIQNPKKKKKCLRGSVNWSVSIIIIVFGFCNKKQKS